MGLAEECLSRSLHAACGGLQTGYISHSYRPVGVPRDSRGNLDSSLRCLFCWRPRRDLNPCYRRESGMTKRNSNKLQERERTGWRSRNSRKHLIVSPMCPRTFDTLEHFPAYLITQDQRKLPSSYVNESRGSGQSSSALNQDRYG